jgi:peptide chain release factor 1
VRIHHHPSGLIVTCQDERSQIKNKAQALKVLRARLLDLKIQKEADERSKQRREQVSTGDRSAKIRTYNFPQSRVTDHRVGLTLHRIDEVMEGGIQAFIDAMAAADVAEKLRLAGVGDGAPASATSAASAAAARGGAGEDDD